MKTFKFFLLSAALLQGFAALANYECTDTNSGNSLTVKENVVARGGDTLMVLTTPSQQTTLFGMEQTQDGALQSKKLIELAPYNSENSLTLVKTLVFCGRAGCDPQKGPHNVSATLNVGGTPSYFACHETAE